MHITKKPRSDNAPSSEAGKAKLKETLNNGSAAKKFEDMIIAQGADPEKAKVLCDKNGDVWSVLPKAKFITPIKSQKTGYVNAIQSRDCAECSLKLGAGRQAFTDPINYAVGLDICVDIGCEIKEGDPWIKVHHDCDVIPDAIKSKLMKSIDIQPTRPTNILTTRVPEVI